MQNQIGHIVVGWSTGFNLIHACVFPRHNASEHYLSLYLFDAEQLVNLIAMLEPDSVSITIHRFPDGDRWEMASEDLALEGDARWTA